AWQRDLIPGKLDSISRWWEEAKSSLVSAVVISFKDTIQHPIQRHGQIGWEPVRVEETNFARYGSKEFVTIEIDSWLSTVCPEGHQETLPNGSPVYFDA